MQKMLFRGKDKHGQWHFGNGINVIDDADWAEIVFASRSLKPNGFEQIGYEQHEVERNTIGQYIGINDKYNTKIYHGDIVKTKYGRLCQVVYRSTPCFCGYDLHPIGSNAMDYRVPDRRDLFYSGNLEIVGNIYDNPELMQ